MHLETDVNSNCLFHYFRDSLPITSTIIPDSMDTLPVSEKTFDVDTAGKNYSGINYTGMNCKR